MREVSSVEEGHDVEHVIEMRLCDTTSATVKPAREVDESTSDVINTVEVPQTRYVDRVMDIPVVREDGDVYSHKRPVCS